jgi:hypothetical protein
MVGYHRFLFRVKTYRIKPNAIYSNPSPLYSLPPPLLAGIKLVYLSN